MYFARIYPSARRLFQFLDMETESDTGTQPIIHRPPKIEFHNVEFSYTNSRPILKGIDFTVEPGEKVAIIGQNGSGKSTILNLLLRFYDCDVGQILADGVPIQHIPLEDYRSLFSVVSQEPYLFLGNILENVDLQGNADPDKLKNALKSSGVEYYIPRMADKERTQIGQNGSRLSGGEKQKLAVARALLKDSPVVILDEATSGFDIESDTYLHEVILNQMKNKTVIMITHHYHNLEGMDQVWRLEDGKLQKYQVLQADM